MATRPLSLPEPGQTHMNAAAASALSMQEQAVQGGMKVIAIPHVNHRAIVMVALRVPCSDFFFTHGDLAWPARGGQPETLHEKMESQHERHIPSYLDRPAC